MPAPPIVLAPMVALALAITPPLSLRASQPTGEAAGASESAADQGDAPATDDAPATGDDAQGDAPSDALQPSVTEIEPAELPTGGGVAGAIVDPDDPNATRAQSDLEGESLDTNIEGVPDRLPKLQAAGWWLTFGAVALATTGGILAGVAETRQDEAERLAYGFDLMTGRTTLYGSVADDYERLLAQGQSYQWLGRGFIIAGAATLVAGVTVFAIDAGRRRRADRSAKLRLDPGLRLRF